MKSAIYQRYGAPEVVEIRDVPRPEIAEDQVLVQVFAATVTTADWRFRASAFPGALWLPGRLVAGLFRPRHPVLGSEFAGRVVSVGSTVTEFKLGDAVFGFSENFGTHAEYIAIDQGDAVAHLPETIGFEDAAATPFGAVCALVFLRDFAGLLPGQRVLVGGASGGVGVYAVQIAKALGAEVTGVTSSGNADLVRALGADHVVDYKTQDAAKLGAVHDLVFDTAGTMTFGRAKKMLKSSGLFLPLEFSLREAMQLLFSKFFGGKRIALNINGAGKADLETVAAMLRRGTVKPVIDSVYPLEEIAEAYARVETRHKTGSVVLALRAATQRRAAAQ